MITKITRGDDLGGLVRYLAGPGRSNEHTDPQVVAASQGVHVPIGVELSDEQRQELVDQLDLPAKTFGSEVKGGYVWHLSLTIPEGDGKLTSEQWAEATQEVADEMGFSGDGVSPAPWVAMRHGESTAGNDHVHMAVSLVREDGTKASNWQERVKVNRVATRLEERFGVTVVEGRTAGAVPAATRAELEQADRHGRPETDRARLGRIVRGSALASKDEAEFVRRLRRRGVVVRPRLTKDTERVTGYSVAVAGRDKPVWFGGGTLAKDLRLPALRAGWNDVEDQRAAWTAPSTAGAGRRSVVGHPPGLTRGELEQLDRDGDTSYDQTRLSMGVRSAAAASKNEAEFVRTLKGDPQMMARPKYAEGSGTEVIGYEVTMLSRDRTLWFADDLMGEDLRLPALRARWQPDEHQNLAWMITRVAAVRSQPVEAGGRETRVLKAETWQKASIPIREVTDRLAHVAPDDHQGWASAARAASGMYAELSQRLEGDTPGPLGRAADTLARSAQKADHRHHRPDLAGMAVVAAQATMKGKAGTAGWIILAGELLRLSKALSELHQARGEAQRATAVLEHARASQTQQPKQPQTDPHQQIHQIQRIRQQRETGWGR